MPIPLAVAVGAEHSFVYQNTLSGLSGAVRVGGRALTAELGGSAAFTPQALGDAELTTFLLENSFGSRVEQRHRYTVHFGADLGLTGPPNGAGDAAPRAWGSPHVMLAADVRDIAWVFPTLAPDGSLIATPGGEHWTGGPLLGLGVAGGYGHHLGARFTVLGFYPLLGDEHLTDLVGDAPRTEWTSTFELILSR